MSERRGGPGPEERQARLQKFLARADRTLQGPLFEARGMQAAGWDMKLLMQPIPGTDRAQIVGLDLGVPDLSVDVLEANAARCRVFFAVKEDNYLPSVVNVLRQSVGVDRRAELVELRKFVNSRVKDGNLVGAHMFSGKLGADNGLGPGRLLGNDEIAMDFLYGDLLHEEPGRAARLENVSTDLTIRHAIVSKLHDLMQAVYWTRFEVLRAAEDAELDFPLDSPQA